jgi:acyl transferase domain-containing protein/NAD(P)-dependent dehydrogenase (short-subunit alcohol dehydrogenase family)/acyl carrier protein/threonine dehydrogenase-like Zn-dependent dehydrogenase
MKTPVAVIGMGCRYPGGADSPESFWNLACSGADATREVPADRWDSRLFFHPEAQMPGKAYVRRAGFLKEPLFAFDALFFGIAPREAEVMDPQQRLLLEVTYEAVEDAGLQLEKLKNSRTGVFIGGFTLDNMLEQVNLANLDLTDSFTPASFTMTMLSNRLSYSFGLQGPSMTVDTACSSSLVATHLGCQSIWSGESDMAVVGGVNVLLRPEFFVMLSKGRFISTHGHCKAYDEQANGYARAEGAGIAILKPLDRALQDGDAIRAVIHNTGVNQDGTTAGISSPNQAAQEALLRQVLRDCGISAADIHYVEAHGTGTQAGDRAETAALHNVLTDNRPSGEKCLIGSVKTNIGHAEAAAGIAGLIKATQVVSRGEIPPNLHFDSPNPEIPFDAMCIKVPTQLEQWPKPGTRRLACVSSFGYGGTNAAAVVEAPPPVSTGPLNSQEEPDASLPAVVPISARSRTALTELAGRYADFLERHPNISWQDLLYSLSYRRSHFKCRAAFLASNAASLQQSLREFAQGATPTWASSGDATDDAPRPLAFVYTGMGPQHAGMGMELFRQEKVFRDTMLRCEEIFLKLSGISILDEIAREEPESRMGDTRISQPANFFIQAALTDLMASWGIRPDVVVGHSVGEVASAYASGALSLEEALLVSYHRGRLQQTLAGTGTLLAVELTEEEALKLLESLPEVSIAAINGPTSLTLAGDTEQLEMAQASLKKMGRFHKFMKVSIPFHSPKMNAIEQELLSCLQGLQPQATVLPLYSTVSGQRLTGPEVDGSYWWLNVRQTVRFADAIHNIADQFQDCNYLEIGPHPVLRASLLQCLAEKKSAGRSVQTLNRKSEEISTLRQSLGDLYCLGYEPRWSEQGPAHGAYIKLPRYPWQRTEHRIRRSAGALRQLQIGNNHPLLASPVDAATPSWQVEISSELHAYIADHCVSGEVVVPGAAYLEAGLGAHRSLTGSDPCVMEDLAFHNMLVLDPQAATRLSVTFDPGTDRYEIRSRPAAADTPWTLHASGTIIDGQRKAPLIELTACRSICTEEQDIPDFYNHLAEMGLKYGTAFRTVTGLHTCPGGQAVLARIEKQSAPDPTYLLHPTLIDGTFQALVTLTPAQNGDASGPMVPVAIDRFSFFRSPQGSFYAYAQLTQCDAQQLRADLTFFEENGEVIAQLQGVRCQRVMAQDRTREDAGRYFYRHAWVEKALDDFPPRQRADEETWLILGDRTAAAPIAEAFARKGIRHRLASGEGLNRLQDEPAGLLGDDSRSAPTHILWLWNSQYPTESDLQATITSGTMELRSLVEALRPRLAEQKVEIIVATLQAHAVIDSDSGGNLTAAPISAFARLVENEYANILFRHFDFENGSDLGAAALALLLADSNEREVAVRGSHLWVRRLQRAPQLGEEEPPIRLCRCSDSRVVLVGAPAQGEPPVWYREKPCSEPQAMEVEVRVYSAALPESLFSPLANSSAKPLFSSFCGVVTKAGRDVRNLQIGDAVLGVVSGSPQSYCTVPARSLALKPEGLAATDAVRLAGLLPAYHALTELTRLKKGEKLLICNAASPAGLAAIEVARWIGAEIHATAGDPAAAQYLKDQGVAHTYALQGPDLDDALEKATAGQGLDVVLLIASSRSLPISWRSLAPHGRLIELDRQNTAKDVRLPRAALQKNLTFAAADMQRLDGEKPEAYRQLLKKVARHLAAGRFRALPITAVSADAVAGILPLQTPAYGGLGVTFEGMTVEAISDIRQPLFRQDGTYLVTGGTKGFGLEVAKWIAAEGGGTLLLVSRSGPDASSRQAFAEMEAAGTRVAVRAADIGAEESVRQLVAETETSLPPLRGVFHAAVVLEDVLLADLTADSLARSLHAKVGGLLHLDKHTRHCPLEVFMTFSSVSALIGNTGQASYVVGNAFLDAFAHYRRNLGLPATSINFGAIADVGILKKRAHIEDFFQRHGVYSMKPQATCQLLGRALRAKVAQAGIFDVDWGILALAIPIIQASPVFEELRAENDRHGAGQGDQLATIGSQLAELGSEERHQWLRERIAEQVSQVLGIGVAQIDVNERFANMGIDSLSAVELGVGLREALGAEFSTVNLLNIASVSRLVTEIYDKLGLQATVH